MGFLNVQDFSKQISARPHVKKNSRLELFSDRSLRDEVEEEEFDQLPLHRSLNPKGKRPSTPRSEQPSESSPLKKSRKKTAENAYGPSRVSSSLVLRIMSNIE